MADTAGSPRVTPRHSRTSSIEALANAASFVQPYKATIVFGPQPSPSTPPWSARPERLLYILHGVHETPQNQVDTIITVHLVLRGLLCIMIEPSGAPHLKTSSRVYA